MALIKQIKVGDTTYQIGLDVDSGLVMSDDGVLKLNIGSGLKIDGTGKLFVSGLYAGLGSGLVDDYGTLEVRVTSGLNIFNDGVGLKLGSGLTLNNLGELTLKINGSKLKLDSSGQLTIP